MKARITSVQQLNIGFDQTCNLGCSHCFLGFGSASDLVTQAEPTDFSTSSSIQAIQESVEQLDDPASLLSVAIVGGEPFQKWEKFRSFLEELRDKGLDQRVKISIYTNLTLATKDRLLFLRGFNSMIVTSSDGPGDYNQRRVFKNGSESTKLFEKKVRLLNSVFPKSRTRVTCVLHSETQSVPDCVEYLYQLGFQDIALQTVYGPNQKNEFSEGQTNDMFAWLFEKFENHEFIKVHPALDYLELWVTQAIKVRPCSSGTSMIGVGQDGHYYRCHHYFGEDTGKIGLVSDGVPKDLWNNSFSPEVSVRSKCQTCRIRDFCGGECYHKSLVQGDAEFTPNHKFCSSQFAAYEISRGYYDTLAKEQPWVLAKISKNSAKTHGLRSSVQAFHNLV